MALLSAGSLRVESVRRSFGRLMVLAGVSFATRPGEILGLIGPNGAGKTTLLECIAGLLSVDGGRIVWEDGEGRPAAERRSRIWYQPDDILPYADQRVGGVLDFFRILHGAEKGVSAALFEELELGPCRRQPLKALSKGYRRRVLLAIALLSRRPLLLLDEPFDGFDLKQSLKIMALLRRYQAGRTLLLSIHQLSEAERICDRFLLLVQGRLVAAGTLSELAHRAGLKPGARLEEVFLALA